MKPRFSSRIGRFVLASLLLLAANAALPYVVDVTPTAPANPSGLWWNPQESGWGMTITQQSNIMFVTIYTYAPGGAPVWYVASNCTIAASGCSGDLYRVDGGRPLSTPWSNGAASRVGSIALTFSDNSNGTMATVIDQVAATKSITRQLFAPIAPTANDNFARTDLLVGGTWTLSYGNRTSTFRFTASQLAGNGTDDYAAAGTNATGETVAGMYVSADGLWVIMDLGITVHDAFTFMFTDANHINGCYIAVNADTMQMAHCVIMTGSRTPPR